jgi:hypothetical protein
MTRYYWERLLRLWLKPFRVGVNAARLAVELEQLDKRST